MIWKDYLKLSEFAGYSKLARASKVPPPPRPNRVRSILPFRIDHCTVPVAILDVGSRGKNYSKCMEYCSTFNANNSAIIHRKVIDLEII